MELLGLPGRGLLFLRLVKVLISQRDSVANLSPVPILPTGSGRPEIACRVDGTSGDQKLVADRRVTNSTSDLEFHLAIQDDERGRYDPLLQRKS